MINLIHGDCLEELKKLDDNSVDSIVTDPPYGLSFMGKKWDYDVPSEDVWRECLRVLKPGGHLLAFAGTRTQHRMAVRIEDAGFEIRDMIAWVYGSGFPKSLNIGKAVDKVQGNEREDLGIDEERAKRLVNQMESSNPTGTWQAGKRTVNITKGTSPWEGWGTALKPALEPITVARKPLSEKTIAENVLTHGTGGINIDGCRVEATSEKDLKDIRSERPSKTSNANDYALNHGGLEGLDRSNRKHITGRFPANLIHDGSEEVVGLFPESNQSTRTYGEKNGRTFAINGGQAQSTNKVVQGDKGSAARFFYCAKSSKSDRNSGLGSILTVKYNSGICKEENTVVVQLLQKVISEQAPVSFNIGESGESITVLCPQDSLSITKTTISKIIESRILNSLMLSLTSEYTEGANSAMKNGGNPAESVASLRKWILDTTNGEMELARGASDVALKTLQATSEEDAWKPMTNIHSTVKPTDLMRYLCRLVTPPGGIVLDPFMGSGSTGKAAKLEGFSFIGIEREAEYVEIARARIEAVDSPMF